MGELQKKKERNYSAGFEEKGGVLWGGKLIWAASWGGGVELEGEMQKKKERNDNGGFEEIGGVLWGGKNNLGGQLGRCERGADEKGKKR